MRIPAGAEVGTDDGTILCGLERGVLEHIGAWPPTGEGLQLEHAKRAVPTIETFEVARIRTDVTNGTHMLAKVIAAFIVIAAQGNGDLFLVHQVNTSNDQRCSGDQPTRDPQTQDHQHTEGTNNAEWLLLDFVDVVVHIFNKEKRYYYALEELWADGARKSYENVA